MKSERSSYWRNALLVMLGAVVGALLAVVLEFLLLRSRLLGLLLGSVPEDQPLVRLYAGLIFSYVLIAVGAGGGGLITGLFIQRVDPQASRRRTLLGSAVAFGLGQGLLLIPMLLVLMISAMYKNGVIGEQVKYGSLVGMFGLIYGVVVGLWLGLITVRWRHFWVVLLAATVGFGLGAALVGVALQGVDAVRLAETSTGTIILRLLLYVSLFAAPGGAALGLAYTWISHKRTRRQRVAPSRLQSGVVAGLGLLLLVVFMSVSGALQNFINIRPGTTATILGLETVGVHWTEPAHLASGDIEARFAPALASRGEAVVVAWKQSIGDESDINLAFAGAGEPVTAAAGDRALTAPQVALDSEGLAHVVWLAETAEGGNLIYSRCTPEGCTEPAALAASASDCATGVVDGTIPPAVAADDAGSVMVVWNAGGQLAYVSWPSSEALPGEASGCIEGAATAEPVALVGYGDATFALAAATAGQIQLWQHDASGWRSDSATMGSGTVPDLFVDAANELHLAWCGSDEQVRYKSPGGETELIAFPGCTSGPRLATDNRGRVHLAWYGEQVANVFGAVDSGVILYESIRTADSWAEPAIIAQTRHLARPALGGQASGELTLAWLDTVGDENTLLTARQVPYSCEGIATTPLEEAMLQVIESGNFHPPGYTPPFCGNEYLGLIEMANPEGLYALENSTINGGFDKVASFAVETQYEVLFSTMQWEPAVDNAINPGLVFTDAVAALYQAVRANPERYPRGMTVRILLGNYPEVANLEWGSQIWDVISDLRRVGVEQMVDEEIGWRLQVANYPGVLPHSHTKFMVVDGKQMFAAGFNYGYLHFPLNHPSGRGANLRDLALVGRGPVAQAGLSTFDSMWDGANQLHCSDLYPGEDRDWTATCEDQTAVADHPPEVLKFYLPNATDHFYSLYRDADYKEADEAIVAAMRATQETMDIMHVNFSMAVICAVAIISPDVCTYEDDALPWMKALVDTVEANDVQVRVMVENANMNGFENRVGIAFLLRELERRGIADRVDIRFFDGRLHTKSMLLDDQLLIVGSQNLHYSSWGPSGLNEYGLATTAPAAVERYQEMYDFFWQQAVPYSEVEWGTAN